MLSLRSKVTLNSFLAITLAFTFPLSGAVLSYASQTPEQQLTALQQDVQTYTTQYNSNLAHFQQYAPASVSQLATFSNALASFSAYVTSASNALILKNQATQALAAAQSNVAAVPGQISTSQQALAIAQANYDAASASLTALTPSYSQALQERNDAYAAYQATVVNQTVLEEFTGGRVNTSIQFLLDGTTPLSTQGNPAISGNWVFVNQYGQNLHIIAPSNNYTSLGFQTYARNGDQQITVNFTDGTIGNFTQPNGVNNPACPNFYCEVSYTAPQGKFIQSYVIPADWDILYVDNFRFSNSSYDATAYQTYQEKQAALDSLTPAYNSALSAFNSAAQTLTSAKANYDLYSSPSYLTNLQSIRDAANASASAAASVFASAVNDALLLKQPLVDAALAVTLPPTSLEVTSTADSTASGTLRWAILQANATAGGIYDLITIKTTEPIVLTSNLPLITQNVTITSANRATSIIDGNALYTAFDVRGAALTLNLSNVTIQNTFASDWQRGSALWVVRGTANVNNVHFRNISQGTAVTTKEGGSYINISNSLFTGNNQGVFSNFGSTPSVTTAVDTAYDNRITITSTSFANNSVAIYGERTVLVDNSSFTNNTFAFRMQGINKHRVTNSVFDGNIYAIYTSSWVPTSWTSFFSNPPQGRVIHNNIFKNGVQKAITLDDRMNDGKSNQQGASIQGNSWDGKGGNFVEYNQYSVTQSGNVGYAISSVNDSNTHPFVFSGNIDISPRIDAPNNLQVTVNSDGSATLTWTAPTAYNTQVERYAIIWQTGNAGWGVASTTTSYTISKQQFETTGGLNTTYSFTVRADNDTQGVYSQQSIPVQEQVLYTPPVIIPTPTPTASPVVPPVIPPAPVEPTPTPTPTPEPSPEPTPTPEPTPEPTPSPTPTPTPEPTVEPTPEPTPTPTPTPTVDPEPTPTPSPTVEPKPTPTPTQEPKPTVTPEPEPSPTPTKEPEPTKEPTPTEEPVVVEIKEPITAENITAVVAELASVAPQLLTEEQQTLIKEAALETFETAEQGSPEYEAALEALLVVAQADDIVIDEELASAPVIGAAVVAVADALNALGNAGADMSPKVREQSEKVVIAAVIVGQVAMTATAAATSAAAAAARRP